MHKELLFLATAEGGPQNASVAFCRLKVGGRLPPLRSHQSECLCGNFGHTSHRKRMEKLSNDNEGGEYFISKSSLLSPANLV